MNRVSLIFVLLLAGALAAVLARTQPMHSSAPPVITWVATARQFGPVGYRDPAGAVSPDGKWIAYSEGRFLRVRPISGGPIIEFPAAMGQIRYLTWSPDNRTIVADGDSPGTWGAYDRVAATHRPMWTGGHPETDGFRQLAWSPDGRSLAAVVYGKEGMELWTVNADGSSPRNRRMQQRISYPAWASGGEVGCISTVEGRQRITLPCGGPALASQPDRDAYGPLTFSADGATAFVSYANSRGTVDLWSVPVSRGAASQLTTFDRDSYGPSAASDGSVVFKVQNYRTIVATVPVSGGPARTLTTFQSETPSWDPTGKWIGITYGTWRRVPDDAHYPDIAQDAGIISADAAEPQSQPPTVIHDSKSEDQSLCWSPNAQWVAFHSHKEQSDDLWLRRAAGDPTSRRITTLGRGAETGWPRWSRDGRSVVFTGASRTTGRTAMYVIDVDQQSGEVTSKERELPLAGTNVDVLHAEWRGPSRELVAVVKEGPGRHAIVIVGDAGGTPRVVHRFASEHDSPGLGVSPDGQSVAFVAPAPDGYFQIFRLPLATDVPGPGRVAAAPVQVTIDPSNKTQPSWSPDGERIAFTVWNYDAQFWRMTARP
jgi:Tol biopolymer transport system component